MRIVGTPRRSLVTALVGSMPGRGARLKYGPWLALALLAALAGCASTPTSGPVGQSDAQAPSLAVDAQEQAWLGDAPPGALNDAVRQDNIASTICLPGWTATVRPPASFTTGTKIRLLREHGLAADQASLYELDHYIPLALGGSPRNPDNLRLQAWAGPWGARVKDRLERKLQVMVCRGSIALEEAQDAIRSNWIRAYRKFVSGEDLTREMDPVD
jgi:hypothetical protein